MTNVAVAQVYSLTGSVASGIGEQPALVLQRDFLRYARHPTP